MELRQLRYFVTVAEERHFGRAAARLFIAQPALSQQIKRLEGLVGARLFERTTRQVSLTPEGEALLPEARLTLVHADRAAEAVQQSLYGEIGTVRIGFVSSAALALIPRLTSSIVDLNDRLALDLTELTTHRQLERLRTGDLDLGVVRDVDGADGLIVRSLFDEPLWVAVHDSHPLASRRRVRLDELAGEDFVMFPRASVPQLFDHLTGLCWNAGFRMRVVQHAVQFATLTGLVAANIGVSIVPDPVRLLKLPSVRYIRIDDPAGISTVSLATRSDPPPTALLQRVIDTVSAEFAVGAESAGS